MKNTNCIRDVKTEMDMGVGRRGGVVSAWMGDAVSKKRSFSNKEAN